jgi:hypothetical protein
MRKAWRRLALFGPPVLIIVFELAHPVVLPPIYPAVLHHLPWWLYLHVANLALFPLFGLAAYLLVRDVPNRAAAWSRVAIVVYVPVYASFDALVGVGTGILVQNASGLDPSGRAVAEPLIDAYWNNGILSAIAALGSIAWVIAMFASAVAFTRAERRRAAAIAAIVLFPVGGWDEMNLFLPSGGHVPLSWWLVTIGIGAVMFLVSRALAPTFLALAGGLFGAAHVPPTGPLGAACFLAAAIVLELAREKEATLAGRGNRSESPGTREKNSGR